MVLDYKRVPFEIKEVVEVAGGGWEIAGYASTFGGQPDSYGDVVARGAFAESIAARPTKFLFEHRTPIGKQLELREDAHGLYGRWTIVDTTDGTDAYKLAKAGVLDSLSIGYQTVESEFTEDGVRILKKVDLYEVSAVSIPANVNAVITDVKADAAKAVWSSAYVNDLPDGAFALVMPGGKKDESGKTTPRSLRKLPHHDSSGALDMAHVRNGLSRAPQMTGVSDAQRSRAVSHLQKHLSAAGKNARHGLRRKGCDWDDDEGISTFAEGSYEQLAEDLEEAFEAAAIPPGARGYAEVVATFADRFVAVLTLLGPDGNIDEVLAEDPVYYQVAYVVASDGAITLGTPTVVEPETNFMPPDTRSAVSSLQHRMRLTRDRLVRHGILEAATP
jgi:HK97 family phage prohead protease